MTVTPLTVHDVNKPDKRALKSRRMRFRAALSLAEITAKDWCDKQNITEGHLYQVLRGDRLSPPLLKKIDAFIAAHLPTGPTRKSASAASA